MSTSAPKQNLELKARCPGGSAALSAARAAAIALGAVATDVLDQVDTYFHCNTGRLKLRTIDPQHGPTRHELIAYSRPDTADARTSTYRVILIPDGQSARAALASTLGIRNTIIKRRELLMWHNVRIHLDTVQDLGTFIEFEAVINTEADRTDSPARVEMLRRTMGIDDQHLITTSYGDM
jgi:predicted adenylyl cyclase CyaB